MIKINPFKLKPKGSVSQSLLDEINTLSKDPRWLAYLEEERNKEEHKQNIKPKGTSRKGEGRSNV